MSRQDRSIVKVHLSRQIAGYVSNSISVPWSAWKYFPVPFFRILVKTAIEHSQPTSTANAVVSPTTKYRLLIKRVSSHLLTLTHSAKDHGGSFQNQGHSQPENVTHERISRWKRNILVL